MKSEHRHELETNWLAKRLNVFIERFRPYASTVAGVIVAIVLVLLVWSYVAGSSSARQSEAWNSFNQAIIQPQPNVEQLRVLAEEYPGSKIQQLADVTWADSQVWLAARNYLYDRTGAMQTLEKASSRYQSVLATSPNERLLNRAQLGMARIYEIRGELDKARDEYLKVKGGLEVYAKAQADRLAAPEAKATYSWLAKAQPPRPRSSTAPGALDSEPDFSASDLALPGETPESGAPAGAPVDPESFDKLLEGLKLDFEAIDDPNKSPSPGAPPGQPQTPTEQNTAPPQGETPPAEGSTPPTQGATEPTQPSEPTEEPAPTSTPNN